MGKFVSVYFDQRGRMWTQTAFEYPVDANENPAAAEALYQSKGKDKVLVYPRDALNCADPSRRAFESHRLCRRPRHSAGHPARGAMATPATSSTGTI